MADNEPIEVNPTIELEDQVDMGSTASERNAEAWTRTTRRTTTTRSITRAGASTRKRRRRRPRRRLPLR